MSAKAREQSRASSVIELKADSFTLPVMKILTADIASIETELAAKIEQAPEFFRNAPLAIEFADSLDSGSALDLETLLQNLRSQGVYPIGIRGGNAGAQEQAHGLGLAVLAEARATQKPQRAEKPVPQAGGDHESPPPEAPAPEAASTESTMVTQPVRSGMRVYAPHGDLVVLAAVSAGAELIAIGNIHVYGTLRGRALAGVNGNTGCRIFCQNLEAELVSISGQYQISEGFDESLRGKPVQVYLSDETLVIDDL